MAKKKSTHGGVRPGAGRKPANPEGDGQAVGARIPAKLVEALDEFAAERGITRSEAITEAVRRLVKRRK